MTDDIIDEEILHWLQIPAVTLEFAEDSLIPVYFFRSYQ